MHFEWVRKELPWNVGIISNGTIIKELVKLLITPTRRLIKKINKKKKGQSGQPFTSGTKVSKKLSVNFKYYIFELFQPFWLFIGYSAIKYRYSTIKSKSYKGQH